MSPGSSDAAPAVWVRLLLRPLAGDEAGARFWVRHVRVGAALSEASALVVLAYVLLADRPHQTFFIAIAVVVIAGSPLMLLLPMREWSTSARGPLVFYAWSLALTVVIMVIALVDGGSDSPLVWLFVLTLTFAALAYPPLGVVLMGTLMVAAYLGVAALDPDPGTGTAMIAAILASFTAMTAWVSSNHWDTYDQHLLLTTRHAELDLAREEFIATTSHEVRTPVASILGYVELLEDVPEQLSDAARFLVPIRRNAERLRDLSEDLLVLSRWEAEQRRLESGQRTVELVDVGETLRRVVETLAPLAVRQEVSLTLDVSGELLLVSGSGDQLERAVLNLAGNAVKYTAAGGDVVCGVAGSADGEVVITIHDTGIGIAAEELRRLFTRFFRASSARARSIAGVGLGLSIVHEIVTSHGGRVEVSSQLNEGTTFTVHLPRAVATASPSEVLDVTVT